MAENPRQVNDPLPPVPKRTKAPGHWTSVHQRPTLPEFHQAVKDEAKELGNILSKMGGGVWMLPSNGWDLVCPGIAIGDWEAATDLNLLRENGFTHILNTSEGTTDFHTQTGQSYYGDEFVYRGFPSDDAVDYDISKDFAYAIRTFEEILNPGTPREELAKVDVLNTDESDLVPCVPKNNEKIMVHCRAGASRSASVVIAYLVHLGMPLNQAFTFVRKKREICPNEGFLGRLVLYANAVRE
eukprot:m.32017 g.32017  ORF g.32017 m.32017 type:complete len:241 (+) comp8370_c0_seq4:156-878(+)